MTSPQGHTVAAAVGGIDLPRCLLLTWFAPDDRKGGNVIVRSLTERFPPGTLRWYCCSRPTETLDATTSKQFAAADVAPALGNVRLRLGGFWRWYGRTLWARRAAGRIARAAKDCQAEVIWVVLDYTIVPIVRELVRLLPGARFHFSIHDDPRHLAEREFKTLSLLRQLKSDLTTIAPHAHSIDAVSEELLADLGWHTPCRALVTLGCGPQAASRIVAPRAVGELVLAASCHHFFKAETEAAAAGLDLWSQTRQRPIKLQMIGRQTFGFQHDRIEFLGYQPPAEVRRLLSAADLLYLPMGLGTHDVNQMRTCLPTKLVTYLECGKLIVAQVPEPSATARLMREHHLGPLVSNRDSRAFAAAIDEALGWDLAQADAGRGELLDDRFRADAIFARFAHCLRSGTKVAGDHATR